MFTRKFQQKCLSDLRRHISLPGRNWFVLNEVNIRFCYLYNSNELKYIILPSKEHVAAFMLANEFIKKVVYMGDNVKMYLEEFEQVCQRKSFYQRSVLKELPWQEISFTREQVLDFAAQAEFEGVGGITGFCKAKIIPFTTIPLLAA